MIALGASCERLLPPVSLRRATDSTRAPIRLGNISGPAGCLSVALVDLLLGRAERRAADSSGSRRGDGSECCRLSRWPQSSRRIRLNGPISTWAKFAPLAQIVSLPSVGQLSQQSGSWANHLGPRNLSPQLARLKFDSLGHKERRVVSSNPFSLAAGPASSGSPETVARLARPLPPDSEAAPGADFEPDASRELAGEHLAPS